MTLFVKIKKKNIKYLKKLHVLQDEWGYILPNIHHGFCIPHTRPLHPLLSKIHYRKLIINYQIHLKPHCMRIQLYSQKYFSYWSWLSQFTMHNYILHFQIIIIENQLYFIHYFLRNLTL